MENETPIAYQENLFVLLLPGMRLADVHFGILIFDLTKSDYLQVINCCLMKGPKGQRTQWFENTTHQPLTKLYLLPFLSFEKEGQQYVLSVVELKGKSILLLKRL